MAAPIIALGANIKLGTAAALKFDSAGNSYPHGSSYELPWASGRVSCVAIDSVGNTYFGCVSRFALTQTYSTYKLDPNGYLIWAANHGASVYGIAVDTSGNVYTVGEAVTDAGVIFPRDPYYGGGALGDRTGYYTLRKYNSAGVLQWSADHGMGYPTATFFFGQMDVYTIPVVYDSGYLYIGGATFNSFTDESTYSQWGALTKVNATTGAVVWRAAIQDPFDVYETAWYGVNDIVLDGAGSVYVAGYFGHDTSKEVIRKFDTDGTQLAAAAMIKVGIYDGYGVGIKRTSSGTLIVLTAPYKAADEKYYCLHRYDSALALEETYSVVSFDRATIISTGLAIDDDDRIYITSSNDDDDSLWCYPADVSALSWSVSADDTSSVAVGVCLAVAEVETPPLSIQVSFGVPTLIGDLYSAIPGLSVPVSLMVPALYRDYIGRALPQIYRVYLTGGTGPIEVVASFISIRKTSENLAATVVVPAFSEADLTAIEDREAGTLILQKGIRWPDGSEQLDTLAEIALSGFRYDSGVRSQSLTLLGAGAASGTHTTTRRLTGISYRNSSDGIRRIRCALDTYVQPGDTADLGDAETLVVGEVTITIRPDQGLMELAEAVP